MVANKIKKRPYWGLVDAFLASAVFTLMAMYGIFGDVDDKLSDLIYQTLGEKKSDIVVIGIDDSTIKKLGLPMTWNRNNWNNALKILNDGKNNPVVIGIDMIFSGPNNFYPNGDALFIDTLKDSDNVVVGALAAKDAGQKNDDKSPYFPWNLSLKLNGPYEAIANATKMGVVNAPDENIARHALLYVNIREQGKIYSFSRVVYEKWCQKKSITPYNPKTFEGDLIYYIPFFAENYNCGYNFLDLLEGRIPSSVYKDKIVLIGPYSPIMGDTHATSLDYNNKMYGIDIHANCIQAFQSGFIPYDVDKKYQLLALFIVCAACEFLFFRGNLRNNTVVWLAVCLGYLAFAYVLYQNEMVLNASLIPIPVTILFIGSIAAHYRRAQREREVIYRLFGRYVDPLVMEELMQKGVDNIELGGRTQDIAVLFVDIRGFTAMSEKFSAEAVAEILNRYLTLISNTIHEYHGTIDKFIGDAVMAFWNAPEPRDDFVLSACQSALSMINGSTKLCSEIKKEFGVNISFGIGIHTGKAVVGNIGTKSRMDYTAIGDTVNTASRLEGSADGGQILISRAVADALGECAEIEKPEKDITLKGKEKGFEILILKSLRERG